MEHQGLQIMPNDQHGVNSFIAHRTLTAIISARHPQLTWSHTAHLQHQSPGTLSPANHAQ